MTQPFGEERAIATNYLRMMADQLSSQEKEAVIHSDAVLVGKRKYQLLGDSHELIWNKPQDIFRLPFLSPRSRYGCGVLHDGTFVEFCPVIRSHTGEAVIHRTFLHWQTIRQRWQIIPLDWMSIETIRSLNEKLRVRIIPTSSTRAH
ncbi:MAG: hypothetical protein WC426_14515 [Sulfuriferula sp.]